MIRAWRCALLVLLAGACDGSVVEPDVTTDLDGDGVAPSADCDNLNAEIYPGAPELCNGWDDDCDGLVDDADSALVGTVTSYRDADLDGHGDDALSVVSCAVPGGFVLNGGDCDDGDGERFPGAAEVCDGLDDDCDGVADNACHGPLLGEVGTEAADAAFLEPCTYAVTDAAALTDANADGLADLVVASRYCDSPRLHVVYGPFSPVEDLVAPDMQVALPFASFPAYSSADVLALDAGVDVTGDGVEDWVVVGGTVYSELPVTAYLFAGPITGTETAADAAFAVTFDNPDDGWFWGGFAARLIPGSPGAVVLEAGSSAGSSDFAVTDAWFLGADQTGTWSTRSASQFADEPGTPTATESEARRAGDLNGDGVADLVRRSRGAARVYFGPIAEGAPERDADLFLLSDLALLDVASGDLDGDGWGDLVLGAVSAGGEAGSAVLRTVADGAGGCTLDDVPLLVAAADAGFVPLKIGILDSNADGELDVVAGDPYFGSGSRLPGRVCVDYGPFAGAREACTDGFEVDGAATAAGQRLGTDIFAGRDTNGDAMDDFVIRGFGYTDGAASFWAFLGGS